jgi:hypothetical protein
MAVSIHKLQEYLDYSRNPSKPDADIGTHGRKALDQLFEALVAIDESPFNHKECRQQVRAAYGKAARILEESNVYVDRLSRAGLLLEAASRYLGEGLAGDPPELLKIIHRPLLPIDEILSSGRLPTFAELKPLVKAELLRNSLWIRVHPGPDTHRLALAACILNDAELFRKAVREDYLQDSYSYRGQKAGGMSEEDLGAEPTEALSAQRLADYVDQRLGELPKGDRSDVLAYLNEFRKLEIL